MEAIGNICQLIDFYRCFNVGYVVDRNRALSKCTSLPLQKGSIVLREFIKHATDSQFIALVGNVYNEAFHNLELALIQASNSATQTLSRSDVDKLVSQHFTGQVSQEVLQKVTTQLHIQIDGREKSQSELEAEREEKIRKAESILKEYKVPQFQKRLNKNDLHCFLDIYDFLNYRDHIKVKDLEFPTNPFSKESSFAIVRKRIDYLRANINGKSDNTSFKNYDNLLIELDKYLKSPVSKEQYDIALSFEKIRNLLGKDILEEKALKVISDWSKFAASKEEVERFVSSLFLKQTGTELCANNIEKIDYFHCLCGRMIPDFHRKSCPICRSRNKQFNSVELDDYLVDVFLRLGMFETARNSNINQQKVQNARNSIFESFYQLYSDRRFYDSLSELEAISSRYELFENIVQPEEEIAKHAVSQTIKLANTLSKDNGNREKVEEILLAIYRTTADYPKMDQICYEYVGTNFSQFLKSVELLQFNMDDLEVVLTDRFGMGYDLRLKIPSDQLIEISKIKNFRVILVEGMVNNPAAGKRLRPFYLDGSLELFKKKIRLMSSEIQSKKYTLFFSNGESYSKPKYFEVM
ncbi:TPA: hypothetical protein ACGPBH_001865 [Streptococcus suis]|nr:hypothetical protein [Streptococcus suis]HEL9630747.1 hypothetical protein [Streptococcus suis]